MKRLIHPLSYLVASHDPNRWPPEHMRRDANAIREIESALASHGFGHGEAIFNQSPPYTKDRPLQSPGPFHVDLSFVHPGSVLLQCTRPPFSDWDSGPRRKIALAQTDLENRLFAVWKSRYLRVSARDHVLIHPQMHRHFKPEFTSRREITFFQRGWGAPYSELNAHEGQGWKKDRTGRTAVFFLRVEEAWKNGPGYICAFGMDGCATLVWAYRLARDFDWILKTPGFFVAELELGNKPEHLTDLRWCLDWKIETILEYRFDNPAGLEAAG